MWTRREIKKQTLFFAYVNALGQLQRTEQMLAVILETQCSVSIYLHLELPKILWAPEFHSSPACSDNPGRTGGSRSAPSQELSER